VRAGSNTRRAYRHHAVLEMQSGHTINIYLHCALIAVEARLRFLLA
jgi:hypothetical protein